MPVINKQNSVPSVPVKATITRLKKQADSIRDRITKLQDVPETGAKILLYGRSKTGKTRLSCSFPKPLLLMGTEDGTKSVRSIEGIDFVRVEKGDDLVELTELLREGGYKSVVLDHAGGFQDIVLKEVLGLDQLPMQSSWGMAQIGDWGTMASQFKERMRPLIDLSNTIGLNVVIIAHERGFEESTAVSDVVVPYVGAALTPNVARWINGEMDYIGNLFIRDQEVVKDKTQGVGKAAKTVKIKVKTGKKEYCIRVGPHSVYQTGFRLPPNIELPESIADPHYDKLIKLIRGEK